MEMCVVAGLSFSVPSHTAAAYAAAFASRHGARLQLLHVDDRVSPADARMLAQTAEHLRLAHPGLPITTREFDGDVADTLIEVAGTVDVTVLGASLAEGTHGPSPHSIPARVAAHGRGNVIVVHPGGQLAGPVLAGIDGSRPGQGALRFAVKEALALGVPLVAVNVYPDDQREAETLLRTALTPWEESFPQLKTAIRPIHSASPEYALTDESQHAALTVVGSHGHGGYGALMLGSVSQWLVRDGMGPVAIVHASIDASI